MAISSSTTHAGGQDRRRAGGHRPRLIRAIPGDATAFVELIRSRRYVPIRTTVPGGVAEIVAELKAATYDCASVAYFKMADDHGFLCSPDEHHLGLDVLVLVRRNVAGRQ